VKAVADPAAALYPTLHLYQKTTPNTDMLDPCNDQSFPLLSTLPYTAPIRQHTKHTRVFTRATASPCPYLCGTWCHPGQQQHHGAQMPVWPPVTFECEEGVHHPQAESSRAQGAEP